MPTYTHRSGEQVVTVAGSIEDQRLAAAPGWSTDDQPAMTPEPSRQLPAATDPEETD